MRPIHTRSSAQAILLILFIGFLAACGGSSNESGPEVSLQTFPINVTSDLSEEEKMMNIDASNRLMAIQVEPYVSLYASSSEGQPEIGPGLIIDLSKEPYYQTAFQQVFIPRNAGDWWFAIDYETTEVSSLVWQLSETPFDKNDENTPLIDSGELSLEQRYFSLNIAELTTDKPDFPVLIDDVLELDTIANKASPVQEQYFLRVIAKDENGDALASPGKGLSILYGDRLDDEANSANISLNFPLLSTQQAGEVDVGGEFPNLLTDESIRYYSTENTAPWYFKPTNYAENTDTLYLQVTTVEPDADWRSPAGLVYEYGLTKGEEEFDSMSDPFTALPVYIKNLGQIPPKLFYVRVVALRDGRNPGTVIASYSKTVIIKYSIEEDEIEYYPPPEQVYIDPGMPSVSLVEYQPIRWEQSDWMYYYEVVRRPTNREYYPLAIAVANPNDLVAGIAVGDVIKLSPPEQEDGSWLSDAWDSISDFFGSIGDFLADVANWVSAKYDEIKADLAEFVAENFPALPEEWRDELEDALNYGIDYGLVAIGVPPSLPNFDELGELGVDYLAATALEQAGIPESDLTTDMVKDLGEGISDSLEKNAKSGNTPNPMLWNFVRQYPQAMYRPAYALLEITNELDEMTLPGKLRGKVYRELTHEDMWVPQRQTMSASFGGERYFELFRRVQDVTIPSLLPGQTVRVPIYFQEYTGEAYPWHPHVIDHTDFSILYNTFGEYNFSLYIDFETPSLEEILEEEGYPDDGTIYHLTNSVGVSFKTEPYHSLVR